MVPGARSIGFPITRHTVPSPGLIGVDGRRPRVSIDLPLKSIPELLVRGESLKVSRLQKFTFLPLRGVNCSHFYFIL